MLEKCKVNGNRRLYLKSSLGEVGDEVAVARVGDLLIVAESVGFLREFLKMGDKAIRENIREAKRKYAEVILDEVAGVAKEAFPETMEPEEVEELVERAFGEQQ